VVHCRAVQRFVVHQVYLKRGVRRRGVYATKVPCDRVRRACRDCCHVFAWYGGRVYLIQQFRPGFVRNIAECTMTSAQVREGAGGCSR
jgi:hypothetical protein